MNSYKNKYNTEYYQFNKLLYYIDSTSLYTIVIKLATNFRVNNNSKQELCVVQIKYLIH